MAAAIPWVMAAIAVKSNIDQQDAASRANANQQQAMAQAQKQADTQANLQDQANNAAQRKSPDVGAIVQANRDQGMAGANQTLLTGPMGASNKDLTLGKTTLLGG
jgi:hypothetical protein